MPKQYWVIGGEYSCEAFEAIIAGTESVTGPFRTYDEANQIWRERALASRSSAQVRYSIVASAPNPARQPVAA